MHEQHGQYIIGQGRHAFSVAVPSAWNSFADSLHDPALEINSFSRQLKTFLFTHYQAQRTQSIRDMTMR